MDDPTPKWIERAIVATFLAGILGLAAMILANEWENAPKRDACVAAGHVWINRQAVCVARPPEP